MAANDSGSSSTPESLQEPLEFESFLRPQVWGGDALLRLFGRPIPDQARIGESWEVSGLATHPSILRTGPLAGESLRTLWESRSQELAGCAQGTPLFPLFVKWLDCRDFLSVQVHPNDELARELAGEVSGKSEAWVVVHAEPEARVYAGLKSGVTREELMTRLGNGTVVDCLHSFVPQVGDCIALPAGTVHSAGGGVVFAEVQQPSDATFRLFDWNREGLKGERRPLHIELALQSITWPQKPVSPTIPRPLDCESGAVGERLLQTADFELERYTIHQPWTQPHAGEMTIWMVLEGVAILDGAGETPRRILSRGSTVLIPAAARALRWGASAAGKPCRLLCVRLPRVPA